MVFRHPVALLFFTLIASAATSARQPVAPGGSPPTLSAVSVQASNGAVRITLSGQGALVPGEPLEVPAPPPRLVLDFPGIVHTAPAVTTVGAGEVLRVRIARFSASPLVTRVVFDLARRLPYRVDTSAQAQGRIVVVIGTEPASAATAPVAASATPIPRPGPEAPTPPAAVAPPAPASPPASAPVAPAPPVVAAAPPPPSAAATPPAVPPPSAVEPPPPAPPPPAAVVAAPPAVAPPSVAATPPSFVPVPPTVPTAPVTVAAPSPAALPTMPASSPSSGAAAGSTDPVVGPQDVVSISLLNSAYSGIYSVGPDGALDFPLIGKVRVVGLPLREVEANLKRRLSDGYFRDPQLSVALAQSRSRRIFIVGEVRKPGSYPLTSGLTLFEALAQAGSLTADASPNAMVLRTSGARPSAGRGVPGQADEAEVIEVDLSKLRSESAGENLQLRDGDVVFVARGEVTRVFVFGEVRAPGVYPVPPGTTVLQAVALAGGATDRRSADRVKIVRWTSGKKVEIEARFDDVVQSGDSIVVSRR